MIGVRTGKIIGVGVKCKKCRICEHSEAKKEVPRLHQCKRNFTGSAKAMESAIVIDILKDVKNKGKNVGKLIGDDDSTTIARARAEVNASIEKASDKNHVRKNIANALFELKKKHKCLSQKVINSIQKNFNYALVQNKGDPNLLEIALQACSLHPFGDHSRCGDWCCYLKQPDTFKHRNLPYGKDLYRVHTSQLLR